jgi:ABC-type branched-subunit amino acid transport system substrate-binding protein
MGAIHVKSQRKGGFIMKEEKERKKGFTLVTFLMILAGALIFGSGVQRAQSAGQEIPKEIRIGDTFSHTGPYAAFGFCKFGMEAAVEDINKQGGIYLKKYGKKLPVRWIIRDTQSDMLKVAPLTEDLILNEKVHVLGGHLEPPPMRQGMAMMADKYKIPTVVGVGPFESWMGIREAAAKPFKYTWTIGVSIGTPPSKEHFLYNNPGYLLIPTWLGGLGRYADKTNKKVALSAFDDPDGRAWYMAFTGLMKEKGFDCYGADKQFGMFPPGTTDFSSIIGEWKKSGCEILWANCPGPDFGTLWRQCHTLGFKPKMVLVTRGAIYYRDIASWGGNLPHGVGMELYWDPSIKNARGIGNTTPHSLAERFYKKTNEPLAQGIAFDYFIAQILFDSIERAGTLDSDAILKAISETDLKTTIHGRAAFDKATQHCRHPAQIGQWRKTNKPGGWEAPCVFSYNDFQPATADYIFPMPYDD